MVEESSLTQGNQRLDQTESRRQARHLPAQTFEQAGFGLVGGRLDSLNWRKQDWKKSTVPTCAVGVATVLGDTSLSYFQTVRQRVLTLINGRRKKSSK
jgi:hypothetical protein